MSTRDTDFTHQTVTSLLGLLHFYEFVITTDHLAIWRRHIAWAKQDGSELKALLTQRFSSSMVFMALLLGAELGLLFNSSKITTEMRVSMVHHDHADIKFWIGFMVLVSVFLTLFTLIATFTAWSMVSVVSDSNAHAMLRSSIGQYVVHLPSRLTVCSVYSFLVWVSLWVFALLPGAWSKVVLLVMGLLFFHIVAVYSAFGRLIILTGAMGSERVFPKDFEEALLPSGLHTSLLMKATDRQERRTTVTALYRGPKELKNENNGPGASKARHLPIPAKKRISGRGRGASPPRHRRVNTLDSILSDESYIIKKNAQALFGDGGTSPSRATFQPVDKSEIPAPTDRVTFSTGAAVVSPMASLVATDGEMGCNSSIESMDEEEVALQQKEPMKEQHETDARVAAAAMRSSSFVLNRPERSQRPPTTMGNDHNGGPLSSRQFHRRTFTRLPAGLQQSVSSTGEWEDDQEARNLYNCPPAANPEDLSEEEEQEKRLLKEKEFRRHYGTGLPRPSLLNQASHSRKSIARLTDSLRFSVTEEDESAKDPWSNVPILSKASKPITDFMRRVTQGGTNKAGLEVLDDDDVCIVKRGESAGTERRHLLADEEMQRPGYSSGDTKMEKLNDLGRNMKRTTYTLSPIQSISDLQEEMRRHSCEGTSPLSFTSSKDRERDAIVEF